MRLSHRISLALWGTCFAAASFAASDWRQLDAENTLVIDSGKGRMIVEMRPDMAPKGVERIKRLAREKIYDGLQFHRVVPQFVAQTGNPNNKDGGKTDYPNLPPEMVFKLPYQAIDAFASRSSDATSGFLGSVPIQTVPITDAVRQANGEVRTWGAHCLGAAGMGRDDARDSANSEIYFMLAATRRLDRDYTVFGRVVSGMDVLLNVTPGEPPQTPDVMKNVRVLADIPATERPKVSVMSGAALEAFIAKKRQEKGADFSICDVQIPARIE